MKNSSGERAEKGAQALLGAQLLPPRHSQAWQDGEPSPGRCRMRYPSRSEPSSRSQGNELKGELKRGAWVSSSFRPVSCSTVKPLRGTRTPHHPSPWARGTCECQGKELRPLPPFLGHTSFCVPPLPFILRTPLSKLSIPFCHLL